MDMDVPSASSIWNSCIGRSEYMLHLTNKGTNCTTDNNGVVTVRCPAIFPERRPCELTVSAVSVSAALANVAGADTAVISLNTNINIQGASTLQIGNTTGSGTAYQTLAVMALASQDMAAAYWLPLMNNAQSMYCPSGMPPDIQFWVSKTTNAADGAYPTFIDNQVIDIHLKLKFH